MSGEQKTLEEQAEELGVAIPTRKEVDRYRRLRTIDDYDMARDQMLSERIAIAKHKIPAVELDLSPDDQQDILGKIVRAQYTGRRA